MDKTQADAIAQAILEPDVRAQEEIHRKRAAEAIQLAQTRKIVWLSLAGFGIGIIAAYFTGMHFAKGALGGGIAGTVLGRLFIWLRNRPHAA